MKTITDIKYTLTLKDIETAIKNYVNSKIEFELDYALTKVFQSYSPV